MEEFVAASKPSFIFLQCGADGLRGDPLTHLKYSPKAHAYAIRKLHKLAHNICKGRILAMGGGGYNLRMFVMHGLPSSKSFRESQIPETKLLVRARMGDKDPS